MTTGLQLALLGGGLFAAGIALIVWHLIPAQPDLADVLRRNSPEGVKQQAAADAAISTDAGFAERLGVWALRRFPVAVWGRTPTKELALLQISLHRYFGEKVVFALVGLLFPPLVSYFLIVSGVHLPVAVPVLGSLGLAAGLFFLPDLNARDDARKARKEFARALGAYCDLVALERLGGAGARQAMEMAAEIGDSWVFRRVGEELSRSRWNGKAPWDALNALSDELGLPELAELADVMRLSKEGSQVYNQLRARSAGLRAATLSEELSTANAASERLSIPIGLLAVMFVIIMITPSLLNLMGGL
ncbi:hypothetical protein [Isoptericola croceus]|uniref:hypothetical protein n=1 Tax=Isoptericola croceus TaxID=3031406 RepID=UPI0023F64499|nr:hypothetical protein [Isoptericola croceus]